MFGLIAEKNIYQDPARFATVASMAQMSGVTVDFQVYESIGVEPPAINEIRIIGQE